jgi:hypothetical protein
MASTKPATKAARNSKKYTHASSSMTSSSANFFQNESSEHAEA